MTTRKRTLSIFTVAAVAALIAAPVSAQQGAVSDTARVVIRGAIDVRNAYQFRGIRQDDTGIITWPSATVGLRLHAADRGLTSVRVQAGTWNSLHSGWAGSDGPSGKRWYESDINTTLALGFANRVTVGATYTAYRSPNKMFTAVKELSIKAAVDGAALGRVTLHPYGLLAFELDAKPGIGQLDGGFNAGKYAEVGVAPVYTSRRLEVAVPVKVGMSLGNYYELAGKDHRFGFASVGGIVTVPITARSKVGSWNVHGGAEYQTLGETTKAFNGGDGSQVTGSIGIGWSR